LLVAAITRTSTRRVWLEPTRLEALPFQDAQTSDCVRRLMRDFVEEQRAAIGF
jgi:ribosomal protein L19E